MADDRPPSDDDLLLFRKHIGSVRRVRQTTIEPERKQLHPVPRKTIEDEQQVLRDMLSDVFPSDEIETGEELLFARPGVQHRVLRKLRRGQFSIRAELDLHGMTVPMARQALSTFLQRCRGDNQCCVRIIHGKGHRSNHRGPVLKTAVQGWLPQRDEVLAFCSAVPAHGGTGAVYVLLKRR